MSEPHFLDDEVDLDVEDVCDSQGRRIDSDYVERAVADVRARRGRRAPADTRRSESRTVQLGPASAYDLCSLP